MVDCEGFQEGILSVQINCSIFEPGYAYDLAEKLARALAHPDEMAAMGAMY